MQFFDREATNLFLAERNRGPSNDALDEEFSSEGFYQAEFHIPDEFGRLLSLFRHLFRQERTSAWTLIIAQSPGIWSSWEDKNLYQMMCKARNVTANMCHGSSFVFEASETDDVISFANVFASFRYDFRIIDADREFHAFFSHDDWFFFQVAEKYSEVFTKILDFTTEWPRNEG